MKEAGGGSRILILDDEAKNVDVLERILHAAGFEETRGITDPRRALAQMREFEPDILLLDLHMPHLDGFDVLRQVHTRVRGSEYFPILVISGDISREAKQRALEDGAKDFLAKPYDTTEVVLRVRNLLETRDLNRRLEERVRERTEEVRVTQMALADRLALTAELRGHSRGDHSRRVGNLAALIASELGLPGDEVDLIRRAAPLHDIGMIGIPDAIVLKRDELTLDEWDVLKTHTLLGARLLSGSDSPVLQMGEEIALYHHENWDGTGYTPGLAGEEIPLPGRIAALADVYDALIHDRPYSKAWPAEEAIAWVREQKARKFDPAVVDAFLRTDPLSPLPMLEESPVVQDLLEGFQDNFSERPEETEAV